MVGITGTNGKTTTAFLVRALLEAAGRPCGLLGTVKSVVGGGEHAGRAHDAGGDRPAAHVPRDARRRRRARARWRSPRTRSSCAAPTGSTSRPRSFTNLTPGPPRLPSRRWRPTSRPSGCCSLELRRGRADRQRRRRLRAAAGREFAGRVTFAIDARRGLPRARRARVDATGCDFAAVTPDGERRGAAAAAGALQRAQRARRVGGGARARRRAGDAGRRAARAPPRCPGASSRSTRASRSRSRRLLAQAGRAGERAAAARELADGAA